MANMPLSGFNILPAALLLAQSARGGAPMRTAAIAPPASADTVLAQAQDGEPVTVHVETDDVSTAAHLPAPRRGLAPANLRGLLGDIAPFMPGGGGQIRIMGEFMDMASRVQEMRRGGMVSSAAFSSTPRDPLQHSMGLLSALRRNIPALDHPGLGRLEQMTQMMTTMKGGMGALGGIGNVLGGMNGMGGLGQLGQLVSGLSSEPPPASQPDTPSANPGQLASQITQMLSGMDDAQKKKLMDMAQGLASSFGGNA